MGLYFWYVQVIKGGNGKLLNGKILLYEKLSKNVIYKKLVKYITIFPNLEKSYYINKEYNLKFYHFNWIVDDAEQLVTHYCASQYGSTQ